MKLTSISGIKPTVKLSAKKLISDENQNKENRLVQEEYLAARRKARLAQKKKYKPLIWFLSPNSKENASWLTTKDLDESIKNGVQVLVCLQLWLSGIRTPRMFKNLFPIIVKDDDDRYDKMDIVKENAEKYFPGLLDDCPRFKIKFMFARHTTTKWVRMCREHFAFLAEHLIVMTQEWAMRFPGKHHKLESAAFWLTAEIDVSVLPELPANSEVLPDWRQIPPKYRMKNVFDAYKRYYSASMENAAEAYADSKRQIPDFIAKARIAFD